MKLFGHSRSGKTRLIQAMQSSRGIGSLFDAVSKRISDHYSPSNSMGKGMPECKPTKRATSDDGIHSAQGSSFSSEANNNGSPRDGARIHTWEPSHPAYTRGIDVQTVNCAGCGEFSLWEFGGFEPYHTAYDHFVGNTDCVHVILFRADEPTEIQYKQVLYWMNFLKGRVTPQEPIGHRGLVSRRSKVVIVGSHASSAFLQKNNEGEFISSDIEAMLNTVRLRFETHFDIYDKLILVDSTQPSCPGMKLFRGYLTKCRNDILTVSILRVGNRWCNSRDFRNRWVC